LALSHFLSRDQILALGYFNSVTRLNFRLRELREAGLIRVLKTPFFGQHLYAATEGARSLVGERIAGLLSGRMPSPRFVQHALAVTDTRIALVGQGCTNWRFEAQLRHSFLWGARQHELRPDGMVRHGDVLTLLEVDMGHVDPAKFARKLLVYDAFQASGELSRAWREQELAVLTVTCGRLRCARLARLAPKRSATCFAFQTFDDLGVSLPGGWS
jgi:hypothetical protein